jgi:uncharacterized membrane protein
MRRRDVEAVPETVSAVVEAAWKRDAIVVLVAVTYATVGELLAAKTPVPP